MRGLWPALLIACAVGCGGVRSEPALRDHVRAPLRAGSGLGDLVLGETKLEEVLLRIGEGRVSLVAGDETAIDLEFWGGQLALQFLIAGECDRAVRASGELRSLTADLGRFLDRHPSCTTLVLTSLSVCRGSRFAGTVYQGESDAGAALGGPVTGTFGHGEVRPALARMTAGMSPSNPEDVLEYPGIRFHYTVGRDSTLEATVIERITIFLEDE